MAEDEPLYDILNEFQKGHSHMAVVVKYNGEKTESLQEFRNRQKRSMRSSKLAPDTSLSRRKYFFDTLMWKLCMVGASLGCLT